MPTSPASAPRSDRIALEGLRELQAALRQMSRDLPRGLADANREAAAMVRDKARDLAAGLGGVHAKSAKAIKSRADQRSATLQVDARGRYPFSLGAEFGAKQYPQFPEWRGNQWDPDPVGVGGVGYMVHPAIRDARRHIERTYLDLVFDKVADRAQLGVRR